MKTKGPRVNFVMPKMLFENLHVDIVFHATMRNKQVKFNNYIYTLSKLSCFDYEVSVFERFSE